MKNIFGKISEAAKKTSQTVTGAIESKETQAALAWAKKTAASVADEAGRLGKEASRSEMMKDAAKGAAIGAAVAVPVPLIGPATGAIVGAGLGIYKNLKRPAGESPTRSPQQDNVANRQESQPDVYQELLKFDELRQKGIITEEEFQDQKAKFLNTKKA